LPLLAPTLPSASICMSWRSNHSSMAKSGSSGLINSTSIFYFFLIFSWAIVSNSSFRLFFVFYSKRVYDGSFLNLNCKQNCTLAVIRSIFLWLYYFFYYLALSPSDGKQNRANGEGKGRSDIEDLAFRNPP